MANRKTTDQQSFEMLKMYLTSTELFQYEIGEMYNIAQSAVSNRILEAALDYIGRLGLRRSDTTRVRQMKVELFDEDPVFADRVYKYAILRSSGSLSPAASRRFRCEIDAA